MSFKPLNMLHKPLLSRQQQGQVMVEYAIILILSITLLIGGIEMAATAFASSKASDGAKAGANEFAEVNEQRLESQKNQRDYLKSLEYLLLHPINTSDPVPHPAIEISAGTDIYNFTVAGSINVRFVKLSEAHDYEDFVDFLDSQVDKDVDGSLDADEDADGDVDAADYEAMFDLLVDGATINSANATLDLGVLDADVDGTVTDTELKEAKKQVLDYSVTSINSSGDTSGVLNVRIAKVNRYKALIILEQITLSRLPLNPDIGLSKSTPLIGDHDGTLMTNPSCGAATYNIGLPDNDADGVPDTEWPDGSGEYYPAVYLFNPKPIDVASCAGVDALRGRSKLSILVGGYGKPDDANYVKGLPKLNQAMYGQYVNVCLDGANQYVSCSSGAVAQTLLKPPGKLCLSNAASPTVDSCSIDAPATSTTGYYFWGQTNDSAGDAFAYTNDEPIEFRPTFQLVCNGNSAKSPLLMDADCLDSESLATVQINTRYRSVFESFLTFGLLELQDANLAQYFYDPSNLRSLGTNLGVGIAGSELGPKRQNGNPTVKPFKDFRGCYEVNLETNQVSACN